MAANGQLVFTDVDKVTFKGVGNTSNAVIDTTTGKIGVGVDSPDANLHVLGNCFVSTNLELGGTMTMGTVTVNARHELSAITATGNTTPHTIQFTNPTTAFTTTGNVEVGGDISISSNLKMNDVVFINATGERAVAVGYQAGETGQGVNTVAVGYQAGQTSQTRFATAVGNLAGQTSQSDSAVAIGGQAGQTSQGAYSVAVGQLAGASSQQGRATAVGYLAGNSTQGQFAIAIGNESGKTRQSTKAVAVGVEAGKTDQGVNAIAVGYLAGETDQGDNSIILNATGVALDSTTASSFHVKPVRGGNFAASALAYTGDGEIVEETNMHFDTAGNVGIGTTSPIGNLSVVRDTVIAGVNTYQRGMFYKDGKLQITPPDLYNGYPLDGDFLTTSRYETDGSTDYTAAALGVAYDTVSGSKSALYFKTASSASSLTEKVRITGDGNVGIGTTNPTRNLHVFHPTYGIHRSIYWSEKPGNPATENPIQMGYLGSSDPSHASGAIGLFKNSYEGSSEDETVRIQANGISWFKGGNVGIGTSSPGAPLSILTTSGNHLRLHYNDAYYNTLERDTSGNFNIRASDGVGGINTQMTILPNGNTTINGTISYSTKQATHQKNQSLNYTTADRYQDIKSVTISEDGIAHVHVTGLWKVDAFTGTNGTDTVAIYFNLRKNSTVVTAGSVGHRMAKLGNTNDTDQWRPLVLSWSGVVGLGDQISVYVSGADNSFTMNELDLNVLVV